MDLTIQHRIHSQTFAFKKKEKKNTLKQNADPDMAYNEYTVKWRFHGQVYKFQDQSNYPKPFELQTNFWRHGNKWEKSHRSGNDLLQAILIYA